jgi:hypothetical protein
MHIHKPDPNEKPAPHESLWEIELTLLAFALGLALLFGYSLFI